MMDNGKGLLSKELILKTKMKFQMTTANIGFYAIGA